MRRIAVPLIVTGRPDVATPKKGAPVCVPSSVQLDTMRSPDSISRFTLNFMSGNAARAASQ
jgi:hypothetical protein